MALPVRRRNGAAQDPGWPGRGWDPFGELESLWGEMGRLFERVPAGGGGRGWMPLAEEHETQDAYHVRAELPGIPQDRVSVEVDDDQLIISGEVDERAEQGPNVLSRRYGRFEYRTVLPHGVDAEAVTAELRDGVLSVRIPKSGTARRRRVAIAGQGPREEHPMDAGGGPGAAPAAGPMEPDTGAVRTTGPMDPDTGAVRGPGPMDPETGALRGPGPMDPDPAAGTVTRPGPMDAGGAGAREPGLSESEASPESGEHRVL